ncbi:MAG: YihY/virulence factor BrkB family protein [Anaerolineales bacterium]
MPRTKPRLDARGFWELIKTTWAEFNEDKVPRLGAALAYYTIFSLAPLLIIVIAVAGLVFGQGQAQEALLGQLRGLMGTQGADMIQTMIDSTRRPAAGLFATVFGLGTLVLAAIGAFNQLHDALNTIWEVKPKPGLGWLQKVRDRLLSLSMVLFVGFLLLASLTVSAALVAAGGFLSAQLPFLGQWLLAVINFVISYAVITLLFALMFKYMPDAKIAWTDVWIGAAITALLFTIGKSLIGLYLGRASTGAAYGGAGALVILLLWIYYSAQIFLLGAEFTQVYAGRYGQRVLPDKHAVAVTEGERARQGMTRTPENHPELAPGPALTLGVTAPAPPAAAPARGVVPSGELKRIHISELVTFVAGIGAGALVALQSIRRRNG